MQYLYSYLIGALSLLAVWIILFLLRKDTKKEMLVISSIFGIAGLFIDPIYSSDWWKPATITNTMPGIESFIFGFSVGGIASIIYEEVFLKKIKPKRKHEFEVNKNFLISYLLLGLSFFGSFFVLKLNSFYASLPAFLIPVSIILAKRKDLIADSLFSAILLTAVSLIFYVIPELITPGWISSTWNFNILTGITILKVPLEDLIWFFLTGLYVGPLYEFWQQARLENMQ